jgi:hypothetical protein
MLKFNFDCRDPMMSTQRVSRPQRIAAAALLLCALSPAHAELYKWVDAQGKTHYSDKADGAGKAKVQQLRVDTAPTPAPAKTGDTPDWQKQEAAYRKRQEQGGAARIPNGGMRASQEGYRSGKEETDSNRCRLARDILSGAARHSGGAPTDANDREIATRDVGAFCR